MKIEDQVCSLEQAKKLKQLGVEQESQFLYYGTRDGDHLELGWCEEFLDRDGDTPSLAKIKYSAFTVGELGQMLPAQEYSVRFGDGLIQSWDWVNDDLAVSFGNYQTEAQARASRLIYILGVNMSVSVVEVNERLKR